MMVVSLTSSITIKQDTATDRDIFDHLKRTDQCHTPPLSKRVNLIDYAQKLSKKAKKIELWDEQKLFGLIAFYEGADDTIFVTNVSVEEAYRLPNRQEKFASLLLKHFIGLMQNSSTSKIELSVFVGNVRAKKYYENHGFEMTGKGQEDDTELMTLCFTN